MEQLTKLSIGPKVACGPEVPASSRVQGKHSYVTSGERARATAPGHQQQCGRYVTEAHMASNEKPRELADDLLRGIEQLARSSPGTFDYMKKLLAAEKGG